MQLSLPINVLDIQTFASFYVGDNDILLESLQKNLIDNKQRFFYLWGASSSGKSHLLKAACDAYNKANKTCSYIPLTELHKLDQSILENLYHQDLVVLDDIDIIAGRLDWETAIFNLYNQIKAQENTMLIITSYNAPANLNLSLNDLRSRLNWGEVYHVQPLNDQQKLVVLKKMAKEKGLEISDETGNFLIKRVERDMSTLLKRLNFLDEVSLQEKRKLTIPFIKKVLHL